MRPEWTSPRSRTTSTLALGAQDYAVLTFPTTPGAALVDDHEAASSATSRRNTVDVSIEAIRERIDQLGVGDPPVERYGLGDDQILRIPRLPDLDRIKTILSSRWPKLPKLSWQRLPQRSCRDGSARHDSTRRSTGSRSATLVRGADEVWVLKRRSSSKVDLSAMRVSPLRRKRPSGHELHPHD